MTDYVMVPRELLERIVNTNMADYAVIAYQHKEIRAILAQQAEPAPAQDEQQPVGYQFQDREGVWKQFMSEKHYQDTLADGTWPIRAIYAAPVAQTE